MTTGDRYRPNWRPWKVDIMVDIIELRKIVLDPSFGPSYNPFQTTSVASQDDNGGHFIEDVSDTKSPEAEEEGQEGVEEEEEQKEEMENEEDIFKNDGRCLVFPLLNSVPKVIFLGVLELTRMGSCCVLSRHLLDNFYEVRKWFWWFVSHRKKRGLSKFITIVISDQMTLQFLFFKDTICIKGYEDM